MSESERKQKNNRGFPRRSAKPQVKVTCRKKAVAMGPNLAAAVLDVSETGVRLLVKGPLDVGQDVVVGLEGSAHSPPVTRQGKVIWSAQVTEGGFCVGIRLENYLAHDEIQHVI